MIAAYESVAKGVYKSLKALKLKALSIIPFIRSIFLNLYRSLRDVQQIYVMGFMEIYHMHEFTHFGFH